MYGVVIIFYPCLAGFHFICLDQVDQRLVTGEAGLGAKRRLQQAYPAGQGPRGPGLLTAVSTQ